MITLFWINIQSMLATIGNVLGLECFDTNAPNGNKIMGVRKPGQKGGLILVRFSSQFKSLQYTLSIFHMSIDLLKALDAKGVFNSAEFINAHAVRSKTIDNEVYITIELSPNGRLVWSCQKMEFIVEAA